MKPTTKNRNAVALGRLGGRKGGLAKVKKGIAMATPERRAEIGRAGGLARAAMVRDIKASGVVPAALRIEKK